MIILGALAPEVSGLLHHSKMLFYFFQAAVAHALAIQFYVGS